MIFVFCDKGGFPRDDLRGGVDGSDVVLDQYTLFDFRGSWGCLFLRTWRVEERSGSEDLRNWGFSLITGRRQADGGGGEGE